MPRVPKRRVQVFDSAARTATVTSRTFNTPYHVGVLLTLRATAATDTPSVEMKIQGWDTDGSGNWVDVLTDAAVTTAPTVSTLKLWPAAITATNAALDHPLPTRWRVVVTHADADPITYEVFADLF